jgi:glycosyltransferase involved in cell wall biosynthesis
MKTATAETAATVPIHALIVNSVLTGGGVDSHTLSLCLALLRAGVRVSLAVSERARLLPRARAIAGLELLVLGRRRQTWPFGLAAYIRRESVQVIHAHHGRDYWVALLGSKLSLKSTQVVVTRHLMTPVKPRTLRLLAPPVRVIAVSDAVTRALHDCDPTHSLALRRIHCGIDTEVFSPDSDAGRQAARAALGFAPDDVVFAVIGPVHGVDGKGQFYFAAAAAQVLASCPCARFLCVGEGDAVDRLQAEATRLGLASRFEVRPFTDEVRSVMRAIDVLVHPAVSSEALGLVILEALACGRPVIASRLDGISETFVAGEHGLLVPPRDADALAAAMSTLAVDGKLRQALGSAGRDWVQRKFSLECLGPATRSLYADSLSAVG